MAERPMYPTEADVREAWREVHDLELNNSFPGLVQNWDEASQTCSIVPLVQQQIPRADGRYDMESLPVLPHVAVLQPRTRTTFLKLPVQDGDTVLCVVLDGDATGWRRGTDNSVVAPRDLRRHHIANAVAVAGFYRFNEPIRHWTAPDAPVDGRRTPGIALGYDADGGTRLLMKPDGSVEITQGAAVSVRIDPDGTVHLGGTTGQFLALANLVNDRLGDIRAAFNSHTHAVAGTTAAAGAPIVATIAAPTAIGTLASVAATKAKSV